MNIPEKLKYTKEHLWINQFGKKAYAGMTECFPQLRGKIIKINLEQGSSFKKGEVCGTIHTKNGKEKIIMPVSGTISTVNINVFLNPGMFNHDFYSSWMMSITIQNPEELKQLLTSEQYSKFTNTQVIK